MQVTSTPESATKPAEAAERRDGLPPGWYPRKALPLAALVQLTAQDVGLRAEDLGGAAATDELAGFGTDASISRGRGG